MHPHTDVPRLLRMAWGGKPNLDDPVTGRYSLDEINEGFDDAVAGRNIRGVIVFDHTWVRVDTRDGAG